MHFFKRKDKSILKILISQQINCKTMKTKDDLPKKPTVYSKKTKEN